MIDPVVYAMNLKRRTDRREAFLKYVAEGGVPEVQILEAIDRADYDSADDLRRHAMCEFPGFQKAIGATDWAYDAWMWSYLRALRTVIESGRHGMIFEDDHMLYDPWEEILGKLSTLPDDFTIALLIHRRDHSKTRGIVTWMPTTPYNEFWVRGTRAQGSGCNVFSPEGAQLLLDRIKYDLQMSIEIHLKEAQFDRTFSADPFLAHPMPEGFSSDVHSNY